MTKIQIYQVSTQFLGGTLSVFFTYKPKTVEDIKQAYDNRYGLLSWERTKLMNQLDAKKYHINEEFLYRKEY